MLYCRMLARIRFGCTPREVEFMTYGEWADQFNTYKFIYNFEAKQLIYSDAEAETKKYQKEHRQIDDPMDL